LITRDVHTPECNVKCVFYTKECDFYTKECYFFTQIVISTRKIEYPHAACNFYTHKQEWFLHAKCTFYPQSVIFTYSSVVLTRVCVNMILSTVIYTLRVRFYTQSVISTSTIVISTRKMQFSSADCDFTRKVWFPHTRM
jgi:hypothetical protein